MMSSVLTQLSDENLHVEVKRLTGRASTLTAELLAHLAEVEARGSRTALPGPQRAGGRDALTAENNFDRELAGNCATLCCRVMRGHPTAAEARLWSALCSRQLGAWKLRRQHVVMGHVVDFYCRADRPGSSLR